MPEPDFGHINEVINRIGGEWEAGPTSHSRYFGTRATVSLFGLAFDPEQAKKEVRSARAAEPAMAMVTAPPPPKMDWRSVTGKSYVTPVRDQQTCGSCVSFATCAVLESRMMIAASRPGTDLDLSEAHLFFCGTTNACGLGWIYTKALEQAKRAGVGLESDFPYEPHDQPCRKIPPVVKVKSFQTAASSLQRKRALQKGPVIGGLQVYEDFYAYRSGIYQHATGDFVGWHAVAVIGYDDGAQCWIAKNSWGTGWGEKGFFRIRYGDCAIDSQVLFYDPDITILNTAVVTGPARKVRYVSKTATAARKGPRKGVTRTARAPARRRSGET